ncbi:MAG: UDP-N-acetylmuramoyl-tripeptide--D-alanyl-D-alanine ligase [Solirubrobacteraceae bacterium]
MKRWTPQRVAEAAGARLIAAPAGGDGPDRITIDSREAGTGALFIGLPGTSSHGGEFAAAARAAGAWGVLTTPEFADAVAPGAVAPGAVAPGAAAPGAVAPGAGAVLSAVDPLVALQRLARAWRRELGATVIGVTGSTGKTSTKDLLLALLAGERATVASRANFNTEIGVPLSILSAPTGTEILVLEMAMRGPGQIAELAMVAEPDVGVIVSVGPVHLELLGSVEAIAAAKAELIAGLPAGGTAVIPAGERLLAPHRRGDLRTVTFGAGGDVRFEREEGARVVIDAAGERIELEVPFTQAHLRTDLLAAVAAARAAGVTPTGRVGLVLTAGRGENVAVAGGVTVIDGCYNANPMSMRAALADLAVTARRTGARRRVAVLGDMLELGPDAASYHRELAGLAADAGVDMLVTVGPLAAQIAEHFEGETRSYSDAAQAAAAVGGLVARGDVVLVKGSLGVGLRRVCDALGVGSAA